MSDLLTNSFSPLFRVISYFFFEIKLWCWQNYLPLGDTGSLNIWGIYTSSKWSSMETLFKCLSHAYNNAISFISQLNVLCWINWRNRIQSTQYPLFQGFIREKILTFLYMSNCSTKPTYLLNFMILKVRSLFKDYQFVSHWQK